MHVFLEQLTMLIVETRRRSSCRLIPWLRPHDSPAYLGTNRLTIGRGRPIIAPAPRPGAYAPRSPDVENGRSLRGLYAEGRRTAVVGEAHSQPHIRRARPALFQIDLSDLKANYRGWE